MFSQTLGTALGDWMADSTGLGYALSALVFRATLSLLARSYYRTSVSMALSRYTAAFLLMIFLVFYLKFFTHKPATAHL